MYTLIDAKKMNQKHPDTFEIPAQQVIESLKAGDHVKIGFEEEDNLAERMWVLLTEVDGDNFKGRLDNIPVSIESVSYGDFVVFNSKHIMGTL